MEKELNLISMEEAKFLANKLKRSCKIQLEMEHSEIRLTTPSVDFYEDDDQYYDSEANAIHLGYPGLVRRFECETPEDFQRATTFVLGHETQHRLSTTPKAYAWGIDRGRECVLEYIAGVEDPGFRFRREKDYQKYVDELAKKDIYINWSMVTQICAGIANSLEDGRIESIRAKKYAGFRRLRKFFRHMFWRQADEKFMAYADLNAADKLRIIMNQILVLATCQLYEPGFFAAYANTPLLGEVKRFMPNIKRAVSVKTCREMAIECIKICKGLAPYMYEAFRISKEDMNARKALAEMIKSLIDSMIESNGAKSMGGASEKTEETGDGTMVSVFEHSDLDAADENEKDEGSQNGQSGQSEKSGGSREDGSDSDNSGSSEEKGNDNSDRKGAEDISTSREAVEEAERKIAEEAEEAASQTREEAYEVIENINSGEAHAKKSATVQPIEDKDKPVSPEEVKRLLDGHGFVELKRNYKVSDSMPPVLEARGKALYRKNKKYFKSLSTPTVSHLDSGAVDPSLIYGLGMGDTEIFTKKGKDRRFDGCAYILMDNSGSMSGNKRIEAGKATALIEESFKGLIPIKIVAFDSGGTVIHEVIKGWNEVQKKNCSWNYVLHGREGGGNEDGYDIMIATHELLKRPERKKMLVVLSDGAPGNRNLVRNAVRAARKKGIEVYSIYFNNRGISDADINTFKDMYEKDFIACELSELDGELSKIFKKFSRS